MLSCLGKREYALCSFSAFLASHPVIRPMLFLSCRRFLLLHSAAFSDCRFRLKRAMQMTFIRQRLRGSALRRLSCLRKSIFFETSFILKKALFHANLGPWRRFLSSLAMSSL